MLPQQLAASGSEHGHQRAFFSELARLSPEIYHLTFAVPNGGKRDKSVASSLKAEGVKRGVPDVMVAWPYRGFAGLFIEMKRPEDKAAKRKAGKTSDEQDDWHPRLRERGYCVEVCFTWEEALVAVQRYFGMLTA